MSHVLVDTSVLIKWFHEEGEPELIEARAIRDAHVAGHLDAHVLDLAVYEVGNVLARALRWRPDDVADQLEDLAAIAGPPLVMSQAWLRAGGTADPRARTVVLRRLLGRGRQSVGDPADQC